MKYFLKSFDFGPATTENTSRGDPNGHRNNQSNRSTAAQAQRDPKSHGQNSWSHGADHYRPGSGPAALRGDWPPRHGTGPAATRSDQGGAISGNRAMAD